MTHWPQSHYGWWLDILPAECQSLIADIDRYSMLVAAQTLDLLASASSRKSIFAIYYARSLLNVSGAGMLPETRLKEASLQYVCTDTYLPGTSMLFSSYANTDTDIGRPGRFGRPYSSAVVRVRWRRSPFPITTITRLRALNVWHKRVIIRWIYAFIALSTLPSLSRLPSSLWHSYWVIFLWRQHFVIVYKSSTAT